MLFVIQRVLFCLCLVQLLASGPLQAGSDPISEALKRGDATAARAALESQIAGQPGAALQRAHLEGLIAMQSGDLERAAEIFRSIIKANPKFEPAQLQLVRVLDKLGDRRGAVAHARRLAWLTEDEQLREMLLAQVSRAEGARKGGVAFRASFLPSSNITGGPAARTVTVGGLPFTLDPASREASGIGLNLGVTAWRAWTLADKWRAVLSASADARLYSTALKPDETELGFRLTFSRASRAGSLSFGPHMSFLDQDDDLVRRRFGIGLSGERSLSERLKLTYALDWTRQSFPGASFRDGFRTTASLGLAWAVSPDVTLSIDLPVLRETAEKAHLAHTDIGLGLGVEAELDGGLSLGANLFLGKNDYDGVYPGFSVARSDDVASIRLSVSHDKVQWRGLVPEFSITRKRQSSNIPLHDTWTTDFGLALTKRF